MTFQWDWLRAGIAVVGIVIVIIAGGVMQFGKANFAGESDLAATINTAKPHPVASTSEIASAGGSQQELAEMIRNAEAGDVIRVNPLRINSHMELRKPIRIEVLGP
jgi:hypothetical protein